MNEIAWSTFRHTVNLRE